MSGPSETVKTIDPVTGLRFVGAAAILLTHSQYGEFFVPGAFWPFVLGGALPLFFVISGFVLALNYGKYRTRGDFFVARFARLWPVHVLAIAVLCLTVFPYTTSVIQPPGNPVRLLLNLAMVQSWVPDPAVFWSYNAPSWSIAVETSLYLAFPILVVFLARSARWRIPAMVVIALASVWVIGTLMPDLDYRWLGHINPLVNIPTFSIGVALGLAYIRRPAPEIKSERWPLRGTVIQLAAVAVVVLVNGFFGFWSGPPEAPAAVHNFLAVSGPVPAYALLIWAVVRTDGLVSRLLSTRVIVWLGTISYGIYLFHYTVMRWHVALLPSLDGVPVIVQYAAIWAVTIAMAGVTFYLIERPARHGIVAAWRRAMARSPDGTLGGSIIPVRRRISALLMTHRLIVTRAAVAAAVLLVVVGVSWTVLTVARPQPPLGPVPADMDAWRLKVLIAALVGGTLGGAVASLIRGPGQTSDTRSLVGSMPVAAIAGAALGLIAVDAVMLTVLRHFEDEIALKDMRAAGHALVAGGAFVAAFITVICGRMLLSGRTRAERTGHTDQTEARPEAASQPVLLADATVEGVTPDPAIQAR